MCIRLFLVLDFRILNCAECRAQLMLCRGCDRGQIYCNDCQPAVRKRVKREARRRHSQSPEGRADHADHQRAHRMRQRLRVMDLGSRNLAISESVDQPDVSSGAMLAIALKDVGQKGQDEKTDEDKTDHRDQPGEAAKASVGEPHARPSQVVCMVCGVLGRFVRRCSLQNTRIRRPMRAGPTSRRKASARSG
jgi:hypothetical protein